MCVGSPWFWPFQATNLNILRISSLGHRLPGECATEDIAPQIRDIAAKLAVRPIDLDISYLAATIERSQIINEDDNNKQNYTTSLRQISQSNKLYFSRPRKILICKSFKNNFVGLTLYYHSRCWKFLIIYTMNS